MGNKPDSKSRQRSMRDAGIRLIRLEALMREELSFLFDSEINDGCLDGVRITRVELSGDGSRAKVWFDPGAPEVERTEIDAALARASGFIRSRLCEALPLKRSPELCFRCDPAAIAGEEYE